MELVCLARKPLDGTVAGNVLKHSTGALNIDGCRIEAPEGLTSGGNKQSSPLHMDREAGINRIVERSNGHDLGRWPANVVHDGSDEVVKAFPGDCPSTGVGNESAARSSGMFGQRQQGSLYDGGGSAARFFYSAKADADDRLGRWPANVVHDGSDEVVGAFPEPHGAGAAGYDKSREPYNGTSFQADNGSMFRVGDSGSAARFFYSSKADSGDRLGSKHPTVKPVDLMRWLVRLITPPCGTVLDLFAGSGTTGMACMAEGFDCILVEREPEYVADIRRRIAHVSGEDTPLFSGVML
jgi:hypothetical protein